MTVVSGHIQIAQVPDRGEPDLQGEVNYKYIFQILEDIGYEGFIGLEYKPRSMSDKNIFVFKIYNTVSYLACLLQRKS